MERKIGNDFLVFQIIAFELDLQILAILKRILAINTQFVKKHPLDFTNTRGDIFQINVPEYDEKT